MSALPDPFDSTNRNSNPAPQPFTGGSNIAPMPVSSAKDNPFADVLNHVSAFNDAMNPKPVQSSLGGGSLIPFPSATGPNGDPLGGNGTGPTLGAPPAAGGGPDPNTTRSRAVAPPSTMPTPGQGQNGAAPYSDANPPIKPPNTEDPEIFADWARKYAYKNPDFANITAADVTNQRALAVSGSFAQMGHPEYQDFLTWYAAGRPGGQYTPPPQSGQGGPPTVVPGAPTWNPGDPIPPGMIYDPYRGLIPAPQPGQPPAAPPSAPPPAGGGSGQPPLPPTDPVITIPPSGGGNGSPHPPPGTPPAGTPPPDIQSLIDMFQKEAGANNGPDIESMLNPMFARQRQLASDQMRAEAALTPGRLESGGFEMNKDQAISDLSGKQSATMADALQQQHLAKMQQNTQLMSLATTAGMQKYVTDINADLTRFQVNTNADLQKWLDSSDNTLKKYGIDTNDVLQRYQAELALKGQQYSADRGVDAAGLQAAAAHAAAAAQAAASQANAQLQFGLGMQGLNVDREKNIGQFILGLLGVGNMDMNTLNGILNGLLPGTTVVKP